MKGLRFGDTFVAKYQNDDITGALYVVARDRANANRAVLVSVNPLLPLRNVTDAPIFGQGDRIFTENAELFVVGTVEGIALSIDRVDIDTATTTPAA